MALPVGLPPHSFDIWLETKPPLGNTQNIWSINPEPWTQHIITVWTGTAGHVVMVKGSGHCCLGSVAASIIIHCLRLTKHQSMRNAHGTEQVA